MSKYFPTPGVETLTLADGSTLTVKKRITAGEQADANDRMYRQRDADGNGPLVLDTRRIDRAFVMLYLLDWQLVGEEGDPPAPAIKGLEPDDFEAVLRNVDAWEWTDIVQAIRAHEKSIEDARAAKKKSRAGASGDGTSSSSPSGAAGIPTGSPASTPTTTSS